MLVSHKPSIVRVQASTPKPTPSADQEITDTIAKGFGALVSWGYESGFGAKPELIQEAFVASGIEIEVSELTDAHGARSGCSAFRKWNNDGETFRAEVSDKDKDSGIITISIQKRAKIGKKTDWIAIESLSYKDGSFVAPSNTPAGQKLSRLVDYRRWHYTGMEFTRWVLKPLMLANSAVKLQDIDGLYYMIESKIELVAKMKVACDLLGVRFRKRNLLRSSDNVADMRDNAKDGLVDRIETIKETLQSWEAKSNIRKSSEDALYAELDSLREEAELLADALGFALGDLNSSLDKAKERAVEMIVGQTDETNTPAPHKGSVDRWSAMLNEDNLLAKDGEYEVYSISLADVIAGGVPESTAKSNYYYKDGNVHARALAHLGYFGVIQDGELVVQSI